MSKRVPQTLSPRQGWREGSEDFTVRRGQRPSRQRDPHAEEEMSNSQKGLPNAKSEEAPQGPPKHKDLQSTRRSRKESQTTMGRPRAHPHAESEEPHPKEPLHQGQPTAQPHAEEEERNTRKRAPKTKRVKMDGGGALWIERIRPERDPPSDPSHGGTPTQCRKP